MIASATGHGAGPSSAGTPTVALGIDIGTSGVRVAALDGDGASLGEWATRFPTADAADESAASRPVEGGSARALTGAIADGRRDPALWWETLCRTLDEALAALPAGRECVRGIAVDGTSGTLLAIDADGRPSGAPMMYDDAVEDRAIIEAIAAHMPASSAAGGVTSGLAKAIVLSRREPARVLHQADWLLGRLAGDYSVSDANNALKSGYDPVRERWPAWLARVGMDIGLLPDVVRPGTPLGTLAAEIAARFGLAPDVRLVAGTTDGCASFLATGASRPGEAVTALGSTLVLKVLSDEPLFAPEHGLYSHRLGAAWLAGGASNSGGRVLLQHFDKARLDELSARIDPERDSGLDYYPLPAPGERFPFSDPARASRVSPRPADDARFLHGLLEGMARIEALGYRKLVEVGAPPLVSVRSVGGGAVNAVWRRLRERALGVPVIAAASTEAALGTARLALEGLERGGLGHGRLMRDGRYEEASP